MAAPMESLSKMLRGFEILRFNMFLCILLNINFLFYICTAQSITCGVKDSFHDIKNLTVPQYWEFPLIGPNCLDSINTNKTNSSCIFYMSFCKKLPASLGANCAGNSVCQKSGNNSYSLGAFKIDAFENEKTGFVAGFPQGGKFVQQNNKTCNLSTLFHFECKFDINWVPAEKGQPSTVPSTYNTALKFYNETCSYVISFYYSGACQKIQPQPTTMPPQPSQGGLSTGSILVIVFVFFIGAYLFLGITWNFCQGYTGDDVLPNKKFWKSVWEHIKEGCLFSWGTITCNKSEELDPNYEKI